MKTGKLISWIMALIFIALVLFGLIKFGSIIGFFLIYAWLISKVAGQVGNYHLAEIIALLIAAGIYYGVYRGIYKKHPQYGLACIIGLMIFQSAFMFFTEKDRFYSLTTGQAIKYYTTNPLSGEIQIFDRPIYDALGQKAQPITFQIAKEVYRQQNAEKFPNGEVPFARIKNFFDPMTGSPLVYFSLDSQGGYHLFLRDGYDPISGAKLQPIDQASAEAIGQSLVANTPTDNTPTDIIPKIEYQINLANHSINGGPFTATITDPTGKIETYTLNYPLSSIYFENVKIYTEYNVVMTCPGYNPNKWSVFFDEKGQTHQTAYKEKPATKPQTDKFEIVKILAGILALVALVIYKLKSDQGYFRRNNRKPNTQAQDKKWDESPKKPAPTAKPADTAGVRVSAHPKIPEFNFRTNSIDDIIRKAKMLPAPHRLSYCESAMARICKADQSEIEELMDLLPAPHRLSFLNSLEQHK